MSSQAPRFDGLVTRNLIQVGVRGSMPFSFQRDHSRTQLTYRVEFNLGSSDPEIHAYGNVSVSRAGLLLDAKEYERRRAEVDKFDAGRPEGEKWGPGLFPKIGRRAMVGFGLGPGGGGDSVIFTTNDGRFDIEVSQGNRLKDGMEAGLNTTPIAQEICRRYDASANR